MRSEKLTRTQRARREDIIRAAVVVLGREGYAGASIDRIAVEAGTTKSTVLYHFDAKESVYAAMVDEVYSRGRVFMSGRLTAQMPPGEWLRAYLDANLRFIADNTAEITALHFILENTPSLVGEVDDGLGPLTRMLVAGQADGAFGPFDPQVAAIAIRAVIDRAAFHLTDPGTDAEGYIVETIGLLERMVGIPADSAPGTAQASREQRNPA
jgi:AcrR family transcriptional regulator